MKMAKQHSTKQENEMMKVIVKSQTYCNHLRNGCLVR